MCLKTAPKQDQKEILGQFQVCNLYKNVWLVRHNKNVWLVKSVARIYDGTKQTISVEKFKTSKLHEMNIIMCELKFVLSYLRNTI